MNRKLILLAIAGFAATALMAFYGLAVIFKHEIRQYLNSQVQSRAKNTARSIAAAAENSFARNLPYPVSLESWAGQGVNNLIQTQQAVKAVMLVDLEGRVKYWKLAPDSDIPQDDQIMTNQLAADAWDSIHAARPSYELLTLDVARNIDKSPLCFLGVIFDTTPPDAVVIRSAFTMTVFLAVVLAFAGMAAGMIALQVRTAKRLRDQRDSAAQLAYVGTLAAGLAHEIRNPLNALTMQLEMLEEDAPTEDGGQSARRIQRIRAGLVGVEKSVSEFLNYAAPGQQKPAATDLELELGSICRAFAAEQPQGEGEVECEVARGLEAWCDVNALRQILGNLLSNGWRIQASVRPMGSRRLRVSASRDGESTAIVVEDAGPGASDEARKKMFEPFFSTRSDGAGLGLSIARRLAEMNGGTLELSPQRSSLGGAKFELKLPTKQPRKQ